MIFIKSIHIENFQSHKDTVLIFSKGLNVITGPTDHGKTAVIRALKWVLFNEPRGTDFIRQGASFSRVTIELNNECKIIRERSKSKNRYHVIYPNGKESEFEGFGNEVPEEITKAHGITKVFIDKELGVAINIGEQMSGAFLLSDTPSIRARAIGRLTGLHIIDRAIKECLGDIRKESQSLDRVKTELSQLEDSLKKYDNLDMIEGLLNNGSYNISNIKKLYVRNTKLNSIKERYSKTIVEKEKYDSVLKISRNYDDWEMKINTFEIKLLNLKPMERVNEQYKQVNNQSEKLTRTYMLTKDTDECETLLSRIENKAKLLNKMTSRNLKLKEISNGLAIVTRVIDGAKSIYEAEDKLTNLNDNVIKYKRLKNLLNKINIIDNEILNVKNTVKYAPNTLFYQENMNKAYEYEKRINKLSALKDRLIPLEKGINDGKNYIQSNAIELKGALNEYTKALKASGVCPYCGSIINEETIKSMIFNCEEGVHGRL